MAEIHRLMNEHGKQGVLSLNIFDREIVETCAAYLGAEDTDTGFFYAGFAQAALPHKRLPDTDSWQVRTDYTNLLVQPGLRPTAEGQAIPVGVPYGTRARLIFLYLQSTAIRTRSREIELGRSLSHWLRRMSITIGGKSMAQVRDQAERIARCRLSFQITQGGKTGLVNQSIMDAALFDENNSDKPGQFLERAKLSENFFEQLQKHPVPIEESAIVALSNNSLALDVYCWLAYRLHAVRSDQPTSITWRSLHLQFGSSFGRLRDFKAAFRTNLSLAMSVYPEARVSEDERGVLLHQSRPPVSPKVVAVSLNRAG